LICAAFLFAVPQPQPSGQDRRPGETVVQPPPPPPPPEPSGAVRVVPREEIARQAAVTPDLGVLLERLVPNLAPSTESNSNAGQTLRGSIVSILIDGVPQSSPLRNGQRDLRVIDPSMVERIEIYNLPTATHGYGSSGSVINFVTRKTGEAAPRFDTRLSGGMSLTHADDSLRGRFSQFVSGKEGLLGYALGASWETVDGLFDFDGDRISPNPHLQGGLAESTSYDFFAKTRADLGERHWIEVAANWFDFDQDTEHITVTGIAGRQKTAAREGPVPGRHAATENLHLLLTHRVESIETSLFHQDYFTRFAFNPFFPGGGQSFIESTKWGGRVSADLRPWEAAKVQVGADYLNDLTAQPLEDGRTYSPRMKQDRVGLFLQAQVEPLAGWVLKGGVRQEFIELIVKDFVTLFGGNRVEGGLLTYRPTLFNAGSEIALGEGCLLTAGYARGFSIADIGLDLQTAPAGSIEALDTEGQQADHYEIGVRVEGETLRGTLLFFYSESDDGLTFGPPPGFLLVRAPERTYGFEASLSAEPVESLRAGVTLGWTEGEFDPDDDGDYDRYLPSYRIPPLKLTAHVEHETLAGWRNRVQLSYMGYRDRFGGGSRNFGEGEIKDYAIVSLSSRIDLCAGSLTIAIENAFNQHYFPLLSRAGNVGRFYTPGEGTVLQISYDLSW
jgi:iron complex outermembrane receptor protein